VDVAVLVASARTGVQFEGQGRGRVPVGLPTPEEPTRLVGQLTRLARCAKALGLFEDEACDLAIKAGFDSIPPARLRSLRAVADSGDAGVVVAEVHRALGRGNRWAAIWELDALEAIGLVRVEGLSRDEDPKATRVYRLADEWREVYESEAFSRTSTPIEEEVATDGLRIRTRPNAPPASAGADGSGEDELESRLLRVGL
jgi:hypothetical protein